MSEEPVQEARGWGLPRNKLTWVWMVLALLALPSGLMGLYRFFLLDLRLPFGEFISERIWISAPALLLILIALLVMPRLRREYPFSSVALMMMMVSWALSDIAPRVPGYDRYELEAIIVLLRGFMPLVFITGLLHGEEF